MDATTTTAEPPAKRQRVSGPPRIPEGFIKPPSKNASSKPRSTTGKIAFEPAFGRGHASSSTKKPGSTGSSKKAFPSFHNTFASESDKGRRTPPPRPHAAGNAARGVIPAGPSAKRPSSAGDSAHTTTALPRPVAPTPAKKYTRLDPFAFNIPETPTLKAPQGRIPTPKPLVNLHRANPALDTPITRPDPFKPYLPRTPSPPPSNLRVLQPPPSSVFLPPALVGKALRPVTKTDFAIATNPLTVEGNAELLYMIKHEEEDEKRELKESGVKALSIGLLVSPEKGQRSTSKKASNFVRGGLAEQASILLSRNRTSLSLWQKDVESRLSSSSATTSRLMHRIQPALKLRIRKVIHIPQFTDRHTVSRPGLLICQEHSKDILHGVILSFLNLNSSSGGAQTCMSNGLKVDAEVWLWKPWYQIPLAKSSNISAWTDWDNSFNDWAVLGDFDFMNMFGSIQTESRSCVDVLLCSHFYIHVPKGL